VNRLWRLLPPSPEAYAFASRVGLSLPEAEFLLHRGIAGENLLASYLSPRLTDLLDPLLLKDMERAVALVMQALEERVPITIYGDYDADGMTATALLVNFFAALGVSASHYVPNRLSEGYGLHAAAMDTIARKASGLLITVDCGTTHREEIARALERGMRVVVTDHHQVPEDFEPICPVVNPHRPDCLFPFKHLSGVGLSFYLAVAVRAALRRRRWFGRILEPDLREYLDLVALGTVADMVPLLDQNRILVRSGLERFRTSPWPGMRALGEIASPGSTHPFSSDDLAFRVAPRLNACGRMGDGQTGMQLLTTQNLEEARRLASRLNDLNSRRQEAERRILEQIDQALSADLDLTHKRTLVFAGKGWHRGVLGIVASRMTEKYHRPTLVVEVRDGVATGSGRSIPGFDLYQALSRLKPLLNRFGGHRHAAGFALEASRLPALAEGLEALAQDLIEAEDLVPALDVDAEVNVSALDLQTVERLRSFGPFGAGNPEPIFYTGSLDVVDSSLVGEKHLKLKLKQGAVVVEGIGFGLAGDLRPGNRRINLVHTPEIDTWQGFKKVGLRILDLEEVGPRTKLRREAVAPLAE